MFEVSKKNKFWKIIYLFFKTMPIMLELNIKYSAYDNNKNTISFSLETIMANKTFIQSSGRKKEVNGIWKWKVSKAFSSTINDVSVRQILSIKFITKRCIFKNCNTKKVKSERLCTASSKLLWTHALLCGLMILCWRKSLKN